jgi:hypothetical protein
MNENVFDVQQGVAIAILTKRNIRTSKCVVKRADLWGDRAAKYEWLSANTIHSTAWQDVTPTAAPWLFIKQDVGLLALIGVFAFKTASMMWGSTPTLATTG